MDVLDKRTLEIFRERVFTPEHIRAVVDDLRKLSAKAGSIDEKQHLKKLERELQETEQAQARLYEAIEKGLIEQDEGLKARFQQHKGKRETLLGEISALKQKRQSPLQTITPQKIKAVAQMLHDRLSESFPFAKTYLKATLSEISIKDGLMSLKEGNEAMANLIASNGVIDRAPLVPRFTPEWWT